MLKFKWETDLGLVFLEALAKLKPGEYLSLQSWAKAQLLPYRFLSRVAGRLKQAGLISAKEGKTGGYRLARPAGKISLGRVVRVLEGRLALVRCLAQVPCRCQKVCRHRQLMGHLGKTLAVELDRINLQSLYVKN
jgi:Rrf2 family protein